MRCRRQAAEASARSLARVASVVVTLSVAELTMASGAIAADELGALNARVVASYKSGELDVALNLAERALREASLRGGPGLASAVHNLAELYRAQGRLHEAQPLYKQLLDLRQRELQSGDSRILVVLETLADVAAASGQFDSAEAYLRQALAILDGLGRPHPLHVDLLVALAEFLEARGRFTEAISLLERALVLRERDLGPSHPALHPLVLGLASLYQSHGDFDKSEAFYRRDLLAAEGSGSDDSALAMTLLALAELAERRGHRVDALKLVARIEAVATAVTTANELQIHIIERLAAIYRVSGQIGKAEAHLNRAIVLAEVSFGKRDLRVSLYLDKLGELYSSLGRSEDAAAAIERARLIRNP